MNTTNILFFLFIGLLMLIPSAAEGNSQTPGLSIQSTHSTAVIERRGERFELLLNGKPYFIKGAGGARYLEKLVEAGGNSIRTWSSSRQALDSAGRYGLTVCMGLSMQSPRHGADYRNEKWLQEQRERICKEVEELKSHPALLLWAVGNEVEHLAQPEDCILVWKEIEILAKNIRAIDPHHPVITVIAGAGKKLEDIKQLCPTLDAIGINSYGTLSFIPSEIRRWGWEKPYIITEFGPRGWWEAPRTAWGLPIEETSTEKARFYFEAYKAAIEDKPNCLGSYVFLWGNKQEKTHTWFNMFLPDGTPTEMMDTMTYLWTGKWPANKCPSIGDKKIWVEGNEMHHIYRPSQEVVFRVQANDPEGDQMTAEWDIRKDESDNPSVGGDWERRVPPIDGAVVSSEADRAVIRMPQESGNYRVFVYIRDASGKTATANLPIQVK
ncbi:MAG TPA: glycoside hydrolase family 2 TIM barrel-domain containing protein [Anaerohalosphaeraceae bacterium]|nr:glycoside hydrolase family 2 TIM barrel-domain containing protein [Anaerohalosphaeraceae bacterium]